ncbi:MAG: hypothetical protein ABIK28_14400 [Planctomycetota bacterium]
MHIKLLIMTTALLACMLCITTPAGAQGGNETLPVSTIHTDPNYPPDQEERYERRWQLATMSKPYMVHNDDDWEVGDDLVKDWHKSNFPWVDRFRPGPFLLGNTTAGLAYPHHSVEEILTAPSDQYNANHYDPYIENLIESGVKPIINLCGTPRCLISDLVYDLPDLYHIVEPPDVIVNGRWQALIEEIYQHFLIRSATDSRFDPSQWEFASWMEPDCDSHYRGTYNKMLSMIKVSYDALVNASPTGTCTHFRLANFMSPDPDDWADPNDPNWVYPPDPDPSYLKRCWADELIPDIQSSPYNLAIGPNSAIRGVGLSLYEVTAQDRDFKYLNDSLDYFDEIIKANTASGDVPIFIDEAGHLSHYEQAVHNGVLNPNKESIPSKGGLQGLVGASWHAKLLHMILSKDFEAILSPWAMEQYWRGIGKGAAGGTAHNWVKLARHNIYDLYEELCGAVKLEHNVDYVCETAKGRETTPGKYPNGDRPVRWVQGTAGKAIGGSDILLVFHHARDLDNHISTTLPVRFEDLDQDADYFVETYGMDAHRGSAYEQLLRLWGQRAQAYGDTVELANGWLMSSSDYQELEDGEFNYLRFWKPGLLPGTGDWSRPIGNLPLQQISSDADLNNFLVSIPADAIESLRSLQRSDEFYLMESTKMTADSNGAIQWDLTLPHHSVRFIRVTRFSSVSPSIDEFEVCFEKNLKDVYGQLPHEAQNLSYERGVEHSDPGNLDPGHFWTAYDSAYTYPPADGVRHKTVGNGTDAIRALRVTRFPGQDPMLSYEDHPFYPCNGSLDMWVKPDWDAQSTSDPTGGANNDHCLFSWSPAVWQNEFRLWVWQKRTLCADWWINGTRYSLSCDISDGSQQGWDDGVWHRLSVRWDLQAGTSYSMDLWMDGALVGSLAGIPLHYLSALNGPILIGRTALSGDNMRSFEGVLDNIGFSQDPSRFYPGQ